MLNNLPLRVVAWLYWLSFACSIAALTIGRAWDSAWHAAHPFETFWSPPHVFAYGMTAAALSLCAILFTNPRLAKWFKAPTHRSRSAPALELIFGGFVTLFLGGAVLDFGWHSLFGLDETSWSLPHAWLVWAWLILFLGYVAGFVNLHQYQKLPTFSSMLFGVMILGFSAAPFMGPFFHNLSQEVTAAIASIPVLNSQPSAQNVYQLYIRWNLTRTNPLAIPLGAFWSGAALAWIWRLDQRPKIMISCAFLWSAIVAAGDWNTLRWLREVAHVLSDGGNWLPLPVFPAASTFVILQHTRLSERWAWLGAGFAYAALTWLFWTQDKVELLPIVLCLAAAPASLLGAYLGDRIGWMLEALNRKFVGYFLLSIIVISLCMGTIDLWLRMGSQ